MTISISANNSQQTSGAAQPAAKTEPVAISTTGPNQTQVPQQQDHVKLSLKAQILALYHQNMSPSRIAASLGMSAQQVTSYLPGLTLTPPATTPAAPSHSAPAGPPSTPAVAPNASTATPAVAPNASTATPAAKN